MNRDRYKSRDRDEINKRGLYVEVRNNDVNKAMRKLKKLCNNEGMAKDMRKKDFYEKPSAVKKRAKAQARKRWLKEQEKNKEKLY